MSVNPLIIALDVHSSRKALNLVRKLKVTGAAFKIGFELFVSAGPRLVEKIINQDVRVFLDLKFHDIPNTVCKASEVATKMGVWMFNVHASGGLGMMQQAKQASVELADKENLTPPLMLGVTVLTSINDLTQINIKTPVENQVDHLARLSQQAGLDGVVCSSREASMIKSSCGKSFVCVTPGIRMPDDEAGDQKRVLTPSQAMANGSDYLVMGRPIVGDKRPLKATHRVLESLGS